MRVVYEFREDATTRSLRKRLLWAHLTILIAALGLTLLAFRYAWWVALPPLILIARMSYQIHDDIKSL